MGLSKQLSKTFGTRSSSSSKNGQPSSSGSSTPTISDPIAANNTSSLARDCSASRKRKANAALVLESDTEKLFSGNVLESLRGDKQLLFSQIEDFIVSQLKSLDKNTESVREAMSLISQYQSFRRMFEGTNGPSYSNPLPVPTPSQQPAQKNDDFDKVLIISGLNESPPTTKPSLAMKNDFDQIVTLFDEAGIDVPFTGTCRLGRHLANESRPRLIKVLFNYSSHRNIALSRLKKGSSSSFPHVKFRASMPQDVRDKRHKLHLECQKARDKAVSEKRESDYVVYRETVVLRSDIPSLRRTMDSQEASSTLTPMMQSELTDMLKAVNYPLSAMGGSSSSN